MGALRSLFCPLWPTLLLSCVNQVLYAPPAETIILWPDECRQEGSLQAELPFLAPSSTRTPAVGTATLIIQADMPDGELATVTLQKQTNSEPLVLSTQAHEMLATWWITNLSPGVYNIDYSLPASYFTLPTQTITLQPEQTLNLNPRFIEARSLQVVGGESQTRFVLTNKITGAKYIGKGPRHLFNELYPGSYLLQSTSDKRSREIDLDPYQDLTITW